ncbi:cysteine-rich KTR domain-containing protein [uncultured Prevotella sp.]|uniref:cysteine-rich KTR domain-containing protein n=1 Tax=uncultured Prevotella sp. TaxID=159272 RepID=UPI00258FE8CC|nr:cysteine-rich KTR domain-containing protein [uncultured Prevotella sp.]
MKNVEWILCPICKNKTRVQIRKDTELKNFPLFCPKCKQETLITVKDFQIIIIKNTDMKKG